MMKKLALSRKTLTTIGGALAVLILIGVLLMIFLGGNAKGPARQVDAQGVAPSFQAILPKSLTIDQLGGWETRTSPGGDTFYAFDDSISGVKIKVSQQMLPESFKDNTDQKVAELAKSYNATTPLTTDTNSVTAYIGTSAKGPQSVIFSRGESLILIQSEGVISKAAWATYIATLR